MIFGVLQPPMCVHVYVCMFTSLCMYLFVVVWLYVPQVTSVINMINRTINEFPSDDDIHEVISRINTTLQLSNSSQ